MIDLFLSGWSFFFRWPVVNATTYRGVGVFLGPLLQTFVFLSFAIGSSLVLGPEHGQWSPLVGWLGLSMLTGFFHEDGLADTADSLGVSKFNSFESLEKIHSTFKDPRLGTFGVSALVLFWLSRYVSVSQGAIALPLAAFVCLSSRAIALGLGLAFHSYVARAASSRSSHIMQQVNKPLATGVLLLAFGVGLLLCFSVGLTAHVFPFLSVNFFTYDLAWTLFVASLSALIFAATLLWLLVRRTEALNGDLLGATACFSEVFLTFCILRIF